ncbi:MAG: hypothetical protein LBL65_08480 [Campylobacteraceae bacterium]|jgi:hypothetical protein|nr:hypothetical protein [Campylobacteraceae bacterium]
MNDKAILVCLNPTNAFWQLGTLSQTKGEVILLGWKQSSDLIDSGIPKEVGVVLANALASVAKVSFPVSEIPADTLEYQAHFLHVNSLFERIATIRVPSTISLLSTYCPKTVLKSFDDPFYSWGSQGQVILLSKPDAPPLERKTLLSLIGDNWLKQASNLDKIGVEGILRPGVDGDVIGILFLSDNLKRILLEALEYQAGLAEFDWLLLDERDFINQENIESDYSKVTIASASTANGISKLTILWFLY